LILSVPSYIFQQNTIPEIRLTQKQEVERPTKSICPLLVSVS
jgi:hypothetical protein